MKRKLSAAEVNVMLRVKQQLAQLSSPETAPEPELTIEEYRQMDRTLSMMTVDLRLQRKTLSEWARLLYPVVQWISTRLR